MNPAEAYIGGLALRKWKELDLMALIKHHRDRLTHGKMGPKRRARIGAQLNRATSDLLALKLTGDA